jgi:hypothetical protein
MKVFLALLMFCSFAYAQPVVQSVQDAPEYHPSQDLANWFESLKRPDFDASVSSVMSCCDAGDAYPIVILQEATIGGSQEDGIAQVTDTSARIVVRPDGSRKYRSPWNGPNPFKFTGKKITREMDGNPTPTAWVFYSVFNNIIYCVVPLPPGS